ncbi:hypothetical protein P0Y35_02265 [Kiritimatiellaeota bacterium B1221]|nr:hypothetical protein [Kiritimatiellaeota bacterium B1221]
MNAPDTSSHPLIDSLESYLKGIEEQGLREIVLEHPFPASKPEAPPARPRQQPAAVPPREEPVKPTLLPPPPKPEPVAAPVEEKLVWCTLIRLAECGDSGKAADSSVILVTGANEIEEAEGLLLKQILHAAGYEFLSNPLPLTHPDDVKGAGVRILAMGNHALQKISPAGMDLKIVRGMWQNTPYGKLIPTFPPSILPDNPAGKKAVWQDLKSLLKDLNLEVPNWTQKKLSGK